jgi:pilus assembly protein CpaE
MSSMSIRVSVVGEDANRLAGIAASLPASTSGVEVSTQAGGLIEALAEIERARPDLAIVHAPNLAESDLGVFESALLGTPATATILLSPQSSASFLRQAMRVGIREVLTLPMINGELASAISRQIERLGLQRSPVPGGRIVALVPAKGGAGATFITSALGAALAARGLRTVLVDLNIPFGDAALYLSETRPPAYLDQLARQSERLDATLLDASCLVVSERLRLLAAPESAENFADVTPDAVDRILNLARLRHRFVLLDMGRGVDPVTIRGLDLADEIILVVQLTVPYLHAARRQIDLYAGLGYSRDKLRLLVNRQERGGDIALSEVTRTLGLPVTYTVPNSYRTVAWAVNQGVPVIDSAPRDPVSRAMGVIARQLSDTPVASNTPSHGGH